jgi:hypothetical protein
MRSWTGPEAPVSGSMNCPRCGALLEEGLCKNCAPVGTDTPEPDAELRALNAYHHSLAGKDPEGQKNLLVNGFLPDAPHALIEAGLRCIPLCRDVNDGVSGGAFHRLEAIITKLKLLPGSLEIQRTLEQYQALQNQRDLKGKSDTRMGCLLIGGLALLIALVIVVIFYLVVRK